MATAQKSAFERSQRLQDTVLGFRLLHDAEALSARAEASPSGRAGRTLVKDGPLRLTLVAMRPGTATKEHSVIGPSSVQTLSGTVRVDTPSGHAVLQAGGLLVMDAGVPHLVTALDASILLVTVVATDQGETASPSVVGAGATA